MNSTCPTCGKTIPEYQQWETQPICRCDFTKHDEKDFQLRVVGLLEDILTELRDIYAKT
jgi:hypothetical protein